MATPNSMTRSRCRLSRSMNLVVSLLVLLIAVPALLPGDLNVHAAKSSAIAQQGSGSSKDHKQKTFLRVLYETESPTATPGSSIVYGLPPETGCGKKGQEECKPKPPPDCGKGKGKGDKKDNRCKPTPSPTPSIPPADIPTKVFCKVLGLCPPTAVPVPTTPPPSITPALSCPCWDPTDLEAVTVSNQRKTSCIISNAGYYILENIGDSTPSGFASNTNQCAVNNNAAGVSITAVSPSEAEICIRQILSRCAALGTPIAGAPTPAPIGPTESTATPTSITVPPSVAPIPMTVAPTGAPVVGPTTDMPTTVAPTGAPVVGPTTDTPTTVAPTGAPVVAPTTDTPTLAPVQPATTDIPTDVPTPVDTIEPTIQPVLDTASPTLGQTTEQPVIANACPCWTSDDLLVITAENQAETSCAVVPSGFYVADNGGATSPNGFAALRQPPTCVVASATGTTSEELTSAQAENCIDLLISRCAAIGTPIVEPEPTASPVLETAVPTEDGGGGGGGNTVTPTVAPSSSSAPSPVTLTDSPTLDPTVSLVPSPVTLTDAPTIAPSASLAPTSAPTSGPTVSLAPTSEQTIVPSPVTLTDAPTVAPSASLAPTRGTDTDTPTFAPTASLAPTSAPTIGPTVSLAPTSEPTIGPTASLAPSPGTDTDTPTLGPTASSMPSSIFIVAFDINDIAGSQNLIAYNNAFEGAFTSEEDGFEKYQRGVSSSIPSAILDDSLLVPGIDDDTQGFIRREDLAEFFGISDTRNDENIDGFVDAEWIFNVTGFQVLSVCIDMVGMGDFEAIDEFIWTYSFDGSSPLTAFAMEPDENDAVIYTMEDGTVEGRDDPMLVTSNDGTSLLLSNVWQTMCADVVGIGDELTLVLAGELNGADEALAFRNINVYAKVPA